MSRVMGRPTSPLLVALMLLAAACGTETGNPEGMEVRYNAHSSEADVALNAPAAVSVEQVWLRLDALVIEGCDGGDAASEPLGFADHAPTEAALQEVEVDFEAVCGVSLALLGADGSSEEPEAFAGTSVGIAATLDDGRAVELALDEDILVSLRLEEEPLPESGGWLIGFDVGAWLDPADLAAVSGDPIRINADENPALLEAVVSGLAEGVGLYHDADGDGQLSAEERRLDVE